MDKIIEQSNSLYSFDWIHENNQENRTSYFIAGDLGGTKCLLAYYKKDGQTIQRLELQKYSCADYKGFEEIVTEFLGRLDTKPALLAVGIAGPILNNAVQMTNLNWEFSVDSLKKSFGFKAVYLLNDLEASAYGLGSLSNEDLFPLQKVNQQNEPGNIAIISPGTGLGIAGLLWNHDHYHPFSTEGGHALYSPSQTFDQHFWSLLQEKHGLVTWEHVLQGNGIFEMYQFLIQITKEVPEQSFHDQVMSAEDPNALISEAGVWKTNKLASITMQYYCMNLFACLTNVALQYKALSGVYLGGGIPPKILPLLTQMATSQPFLKHPNMNLLLKKIPVYVIQNEETALNGAAIFAAWVKK